jgi:hypothetical protein
VRLCLPSLLFLGCLGCAALHVDDPRFVDAGDPSQPDPDGDPSGRADAGPGDELPTVMLTAPLGGAAVSAGTLRIEGTARDDRGVGAVFVKVGPNAPRLARSSDSFGHFWLESPIPQGMFSIEAWAHDTAGQEGPSDVVTVLGPVSGSDDAAPTVSVTEPADGSAPLHTRVLVRGTTQDDRGVVAMELFRNGEPLPDQPAETDDFFATWSWLVPLRAGVDNELRFVARDAGGRTGETTIHLFGRAEIDREPPELAIDAPAAGATVNTDRLSVSGTAADRAGLDEVKVRVGTRPAGASDVVWSDYLRATTLDQFETWTREVELPVGEVTIEARAIDLSGLATSATVTVTNSFVPTWSTERELPLRLREEQAPTLKFELDEEGVNDVIDADIQKDTVLLELETRDMLTNAVEQIKVSCGTAWRNNDSNPRHDCELTPLGRTFGDAQGVRWQDSAEYSLVRLLTMTPKNAVVDGTSVDQLENLADSLSVGGGFHEILADTFGIGVTSEIIPTAAVVRALQNYWMASHPEVLPGAKLPITLFDGMNDLGPLKDRLGPKSGHPGLLDPSFTPHSEVFGADFKLLLGARSNLRWLDGVDLSSDGGDTAKDYIAVVADSTGPTFDDVLEFDFTDPAMFDVVGLTPNPTVDLRMVMQENAAWIDSCLPSRGGESGCKNNLPGSPLAGFIWSRPRYQVETLIAGSAYEQYRTRANVRNEYRWLLGIIKAAEVTVGRGHPAGWATFSTFLDIGSPPEAQYLWELILEVGQKALHNFSGQTLPEGRANVAFTLHDVDVGLTASEIRAAMRPELQRQRHKLSDRLLGDYQRNNGAVDFYYRRGADNAPYLFFAAASDPLPDSEYTYTQPGFFADEALTTKLSSTAAGTSGDSVHEKIALPTGETTLYVKDETSSVFRLRCVVGAPGDAGEISVFVARKVR